MQTVVRRIALLLLLLTPAPAVAQHAPLAPPLPSSASVPAGRHSATPVRVTLDPAVRFDLVNYWLGTPQITWVDPPDPHGAAGPKGIVEINNTRIAYRRKDTVAVWAANRLYSFFPLNEEGILVDPRVIYDPDTQRFFALCIAAHYSGDNSQLTGHLYLAVSKNADPVTPTDADWWFFTLDLTQTYQGVKYGPDYPCVGVDARALTITANMFPLPFVGPGDLLDVTIVTLDKARLVNGEAVPRIVHTPLQGDAFTLQPVSPLAGSDPGNRTYFVEVPFYGADPDVRLWSLEDPLGAATLHNITLASTTYGSYVQQAPQCDGPDPLTTLPRRAQGSAFLRDGEIWFCWTGSNGPVSAVYYDVLAPGGFPAGTASVVESGMVTADPSGWAFQPAIGGNARGDVCLVFTQSSSSTCPQMYVTARSAADHAFGVPRLVVGSAIYHPRLASEPWAYWGDYAVAAVDPLDQSFWVSDEYQAGSNPESSSWWQTVWTNVVVGPSVAGWPAAGRLASGSLTPIDHVVAATDGAGGILLAWCDTRDATRDAIVYGTRLLADGSRAPGWTEAGTRVSGAGWRLRDQDPVVAPDGAGGAYLSFVYLDGTVRVQHMTSGGGVAAGWPEDGLSLQDGARQVLAAIDGGDVVVAWVAGGVRAQRLGPAGEPRWGAGVTVAASGAVPEVAPDGHGGVYVAYVSGGIKVRHVASDGTLTGAAPAALGSGLSPRLAADASGAYVVWQSTDADGNPDVYASRVDLSGTIASGWPAGGLAVAAAPDAQTAPAVVIDAGHALVAWQDGRRSDVGDLGDIRLQRLEADGHLASGWPVTGVLVCTIAGLQHDPAVVGDGAGGALVVWTDDRPGPECPAGCDDRVYLQRVSAAGTIAPGSPDGGVPVAVATAGMQQRPSVIAGVSGDAYVTWQDGRAYACDPFCISMVYAQRTSLATAGVPDVPQPTLALAAPRPNPARDAVELSFDVPAALAGTPWSLAVFDLAGRRVASFGAGRAVAGERRIVWDARDGAGVRLRRGVYFVALRVGRERRSTTVVVL